VCECMSFCVKPFTSPEPPYNNHSLIVLLDDIVAKNSMAIVYVNLIISDSNYVWVQALCAACLKTAAFTIYTHAAYKGDCFKPAGTLQRR
jgi:hypothetical protein